MLQLRTAILKLHLSFDPYVHFFLFLSITYIIKTIDGDGGGGPSTKILIDNPVMIYDSKIPFVQ